MARTSTTVDADAPSAGTATGRRTGQQTASDLAFLARAMKAPALLAAVDRLAERARTISARGLDCIKCVLLRLGEHTTRAGAICVS